MGLYTKIIDLQKMDAGLQKVVRNKPAAGADGITYDMFWDNKKEYLKQMKLELSEHRYRPVPIKLVSIYKGEKERKVALYSMRDKVLQQSIAAELQKIYEPLFSEGTYAYRSGRSAMQAIGSIEENMCRMKEGWVLKMDIQSFFDTISAEKLRQELKRVIKEEDVVELIMEQAQAESLQSDGEIVKKTRGIWQGSGIAPVLSNIYLKDYDYEMKRRSAFFARYSDDILAIAGSREAASELLRFTIVYMQGKELSLNEKKTLLVPVEGGIDFLGYHFDGKGKSVPVKAELGLQDRLESMFLTATGMSVKEKLKKGTEILGGWEQYYREERPICGILEYAAALYMARNKGPAFDRLMNLRPSYKNQYRELAEYMTGVWKEQGRKDLELLEYEQLYGLDELDKGRVEDYGSPFVKELTEGFQKLLVCEEPEVIMELIQDYTELQCLNKASHLMERYQNLQSEGNKIVMPPAHEIQQNQEIDSEARQLFYELFVGREDAYSEESMSQRRVVEQKNAPLTEDVLKDHLSGTRTIGTYVQRPNGTAKYLVLDIDISKKVLLKYTVDSLEFSQYMELCGQIAGQTVKILHKMGLKGYVENSGYRGYHVWIFFTEWFPVRYVNALSQILSEELSSIQREEITIEFFPDARRVRGDKPGQSIKLPLGMNPRSGMMGYFLDENFLQVTDLSMYMKNVARFSLSAVKRIIGMRTGKKTEPVWEAERNILDNDLEGFGKIPEGVRAVLERCNLMCYLCQKARKTGYLSHGERLSVLYVFGHMGDEGKDFLHQIMSYTLNYQYQTTERFINKIPEKPISCIKLRDQYRQITAEIGCTCDFKRTKNCYPSPVLHALKSLDTADGQITIPTSRTLSKEKEQTVYQELNVYRKVQEIAERVLELKRQKRGLDKKVVKAEKELENIFDGMHVDCLEIEMGMLCRRRKEDGNSEWLIEI